MPNCLAANLRWFEAVLPVALWVEAYGCLRWHLDQSLFTGLINLAECPSRKRKLCDVLTFTDDAISVDSPPYQLDQHIRHPNGHQYIIPSPTSANTISSHYQLYHHQIVPLPALPSSNRPTTSSTIIKSSHYQLYHHQIVPLPALPSSNRPTTNSTIIKSSHYQLYHHQIVPLPALPSSNRPTTNSTIIKSSHYQLNQYQIVPLPT